MTTRKNPDSVRSGELIPKKRAGLPARVDEEKKKDTKGSRWLGFVQSAFRGIMDYLDETPGGIRRATEKVKLYGELHDATANTIESLVHLKNTEQRISLEQAQRMRDHERAEAEHAHLLAEKAYEQEKNERAKGRLELEDKWERAKLRTNIDETERTQQARKPKKANEQGDPVLRKAEAVLAGLREQDEVEEKVRRLQEKLLAQIDAAETDPERAEQRKERINEMIAKRLMEL
jgi:hypothetical protein